MLGPFLIFMRSPRLCPLEFSQQVVSELKVRAAVVDMTVTGSYEMRSVEEGLSLEWEIVGIQV